MRFENRESDLTKSAVTRKISYCSEWTSYRYEYAQNKLPRFTTAVLWLSQQYVSYLLLPIKNGMLPKPRQY